VVENAPSAPTNTDKSSANDGDDPSKALNVKLATSKQLFAFYRHFFSLSCQLVLHKAVACTLCLFTAIITSLTARQRLIAPRSTMIRCHEYFIRWKSNEFTFFDENIHTSRSKSSSIETMSKSSTVLVRAVLRSPTSLIKPNYSDGHKAALMTGNSDTKILQPARAM
jgi:ribosomal protein L32E